LMSVTRSIFSTTGLSLTCRSAVMACASGAKPASATSVNRDDKAFDGFMAVLLGGWLIRRLLQRERQQVETAKERDRFNAEPRWIECPAGWGGCTAAEF